MKHLEDFVAISQSEVPIVMTGTKKAVLLRGSHGIGKTTILKNWGIANGFDVIVLLGSQMADAGDLIGVPYRCDGGMEYAIPAKFKGDNKKLLILDELNRSPKDVRDSFFSLALEGEIPQTGYKLPAGSRVAATMNPDTEYYQVDTLDPALLDRFHRFELVVNTREWLTFASGKINSVLLEFLNKNQVLITQIGCRAWFELGELDDMALGNYKIAASKVGKTNASAWIEYFRKNIDSWEDIFANVEQRSAHEVCSALSRSLQILEGLTNSGQISSLIKKVEDVITRLQKQKRKEELAYFYSEYQGDCYQILCESDKIRNAVVNFVEEV